MDGIDESVLKRRGKLLDIAHIATPTLDGNNNLGDCHLTLVGLQKDKEEVPLTVLL